MPAAALTHGKWAIVVCHETIERSGPTLTKLRYCFASLDAEGNTLVLDAPAFLQKCMRESEEREVEACVERWERDVELLRQRAYTERSAYAAEAVRSAFDRHGEMQLGFCGVAEVDEVFRALRENGRIVAVAPQAA